MTTVPWLAFGLQLVLAMALWRALPAMQPTRLRDLRRLTTAAAVVVVVAFTAALVERNERFFGADAPVSTTFERDLRPRIWAKAVEAWPQYTDYQAKTSREIPVVVMTPVAA